MTDVETLRLQVRALEDRLSMALSLMQDMEIVTAADGNIPDAEYWELQQDLLLGKNTEALNFAREEARKFGFYKSSLSKVRAWLCAGVMKAAA